MGDLAIAHKGGEYEKPGYYNHEPKHSVHTLNLKIINSYM